MARCGAVGSESSVKALSKSPGALRLERERDRSHFYVAVGRSAEISPEQKVKWDPLGPEKDGRWDVCQW